MICIEHVTVEYEKGIKALDDFSLMIKPGELIVLCGKSGCGKTTATRLINGLIPHFYQADADCHPKRPPVPYYPASVSHIIRPAINHYSTVLLT